MMQTYNAPTDADLWLKATEFFRTCKPTAYRAMSREGNLEDVARRRVDACKSYAQRLINSGIWEGDAWNQAIRAELLESESD